MQVSKVGLRETSKDTLDTFLETLEWYFTGGGSTFLSPRMQLFSHMTLNLVKFEKLHPEILDEAIFRAFEEANVAKYIFK